MTDEGMEAVRQDTRLLKEHASITQQSLDVIAQTLASVAANQEQFNQQLKQLAEVQLRADERFEKLAQAQFRTDEAVQKLSATVDRLSATVDRYLNARLNGNQQN